MAYPSVAIWEPMDESWIDPTLISVARSGSVKVRRLSSAKRRVFKFSHKYISNADRLTIEAFYDANRLVLFVFQHPLTAVNYNVVFGDPDGPQVSLVSPGLYDVRVTLLQVI